MPYSLSEDQQKALLMVYIENSFVGMKEANEKRGPCEPERKISDNERYSQVNTLIREAKLPFETIKPVDKEKWSACDIENQLADLIYQHIPGDSLHSLLYAIYDTLNEKHHFDVNVTSQSEATEKRSRAGCALQHLTIRYHSREFKASKNKALKETLLSCLFIVTIPFAPFIYYFRCKHHSQNHCFQAMFVDEEYLKAAKEGRAARAKPKKEDSTTQMQKHMYGMLCKVATGSSKPFKEIVFSKNHRVRKFIESASDGWGGKTGITLLGTKKQIQKSAEKFNDYLEEVNKKNYDPWRNL